MTAEQKMSENHDHGDDVAAYVLGALEPDELEAFQLHLRECAACREEVAALQPVADSLPATVTPLAAPAGLRRRVFDAVRAEPKDAAAGSLEQDEPAPAGAPSPPERRAPAATPRRRRRRPLWTPRLAPALAGALAAAAVAVGIVELTSSGSSGTRVIQASVRGAGTAELRVTGGRGELVVNHFPAPPSGHIYQVWLQHGQHAAPAPTRTLFNVTTTGAGDIGLTANLHGVSAVLVTAEPAGGTQVPTTAPVITAQLS